MPRSNLLVIFDITEALKTVQAQEYWWKITQSQN